MRGLPFYLFTATSIVLSASCLAQTSLGLAGVQASSTSTYAYAGEIRPLNGNSLGQGGYRKIILRILPRNYKRRLLITRIISIKWIMLNT